MIADRHADLLHELELELVPDPPDPTLEADRPEADRFKITGPRQAEWALLKLAQAARRRDELLEVVAAERDRLAAFEDRARADYSATAEFFEALLTEWHRGTVTAELAAQAAKARAALGDDATPEEVDAAAWPKVKNKTVTLPAGKVAARRTADRVTLPADAPAAREAFTTWARAEVPELVRVKLEPDLTAVARAVKAGEELAALTAALERLEPDVADEARRLLAELEADRAAAGEPTVALLVGPTGEVLTLEGEVVPHLHLERGAITYKVEPTA